MQKYRQVAKILHENVNFSKSENVNLVNKISAKHFSLYLMNAGS